MFSAELVHMPSLLHRIPHACHLTHGTHSFYAFVLFIINRECYKIIPYMCVLP